MQEEINHHTVRGSFWQLFLSNKIHVQWPLRGVNVDSDYVPFLKLRLNSDPDPGPFLYSDPDPNSNPDAGDPD